MASCDAGGSFAVSLCISAAKSIRPPATPVRPPCLPPPSGEVTFPGAARGSSEGPPLSNGGRLFTVRSAREVMPCRAVPCRAVPCCAVPCRAEPGRAAPWGLFMAWRRIVQAALTLPGRNEASRTALAGCRRPTAVLNRAGEEVAANGVSDLTPTHGSHAPVSLQWCALRTKLDGQRASRWIAANQPETLALRSLSHVLSLPSRHNAGDSAAEEAVAV